MNTSYTNVHRALLQSFLSHTTHTTTTLRPTLSRLLSVEEQRQVLPNDITNADITSHIAIINASVSPYDLEIRSAYTQQGHITKYGNDEAESEGGHGRILVWALVNTTADALSQLATTRTADEIAFITRVLDAMFETNNSPTGRGGKEVCAVSSMAAIKLCRPNGTESQRRARTSGVGVNGETPGPVKALGMQDAEALLQSLVQEGWFEMVTAPGERRPDWFILSPRALMELKGWLLSSYNETADSAPASEEDSDGEGGRGRELVKLCKACNEIVISGQRCAEKRCGARLHDACCGAMWRTQRNEKRCPVCSTEWTGEDFVGVRALARRRVTGDTRRENQVMGTPAGRVTNGAESSSAARGRAANGRPNGNGSRLSNVDGPEDDENED